jgi:hypothetical protein
VREASEADKCLEMRERAQREREGKRDFEVITEAGDQRRHQTNNPSKEPISLSFYPGPICSGVGLKKKKKKKHGIRGSSGFYLDGSMENRSRRAEKRKGTWASFLIVKKAVV